MKRAPNLQKMLDHLQEKMNIPNYLNEGSDHPYDCRCDTCKQWWMNVGPDEDGLYGPFSVEEMKD